jgi:hypothetical protein
MLIFLAPSILLITALFMLVLHRIKPAFAYHWLIATSGALIALAFSWLSRLAIPVSISLPDWQSVSLFQLSPLLIFDSLSWSFTVAVTTLLVSSNLSKLVRNPKSAERYSQFSVINDLLITAVSLLAALAGNLLALVMMWSALDLFTLFIRLKEIKDDENSMIYIVPYLLNSLGIFFIILASTLAQGTGLSLEFANISPNLTPVIFIALGARLAVIPISPIIHLPGINLQDSSIIQRMAPLAATFIPIIRLGSVGAPLEYQTILLAFAALAAVFSAISWLNSPDETSGLSYWILGISAFVLASSIRSQASASFAWSLILLQSGALLFLYSARQRWLIPIFSLSLIGISTLPFTPAWNAVQIYALPFQPITLIFIFSQSILILGYLKHGLHEAFSLNQAERWVWVMYPLGLSLLPLSHFAVAWWNRSASLPTLIESWPGLVVILVAFPLFFWKAGNNLLTKKWVLKIIDLLSFRWFYNFLYRLLINLQNLFHLINQNLEGSGSILWAIVILFLLVSLFIQVGLGGF